MHSRIRAVSAFLPYARRDPDTGEAFTIPSQPARRRSFGCDLREGRLFVDFVLEEAQSATVVHEIAAGSFAAIRVPEESSEALMAKLLRGLTALGYRSAGTKPPAALAARWRDSATASIVPPRDPALRKLHECPDDDLARSAYAQSLRARGESTLREFTQSRLDARVTWRAGLVDSARLAAGPRDHLGFTSFEALVELLMQPVSQALAALVFGAPCSPESAEELASDGHSLWSMEATLAWLAIAGPPTLQQVEIEAPDGEEIVLGPTKALFAALPSLRITSGGRVLASR